MASKSGPPDILPYQFEPLVSDSDSSEEENSSSGESSASDGEKLNPERVGNTDWCSCASCASMTTGRESLCCQELGPVHQKAQNEGVTCITKHSGFDSVCINRDSLEVSLFEFARMEGPLDDNQPIHELYRYLSYRRFTRWTWHILGTGNRKVLPACAVNKIRTAFPSEEYTGFKYVRF